ncbi:hypothetical protein Tco_1226140 [Tanacetum coccineum]
MKDIFEELEAEVDQNVVNRKHDEIERKNLLIANDNVIADCLSKEVFYIATNSELTVSRFTDMHEAYTIVQTRCLELEAEISKLRDKVQKDDHTELVKRRTDHPLVFGLRLFKTYDGGSLTAQEFREKCDLQVEDMMKSSPNLLTVQSLQEQIMVVASSFEPHSPILVNSAGTSSSTTIDQDSPSPSHSPSYSALQSPSIHQGVAVESTLVEENPFAPVDNDPFINILAPEPTSEASLSGDVNSGESTYVTQTLHHLGKWSKDHPLDNVIGNPSRPVSTRKQLSKPKNFKSALLKIAGSSLQDEIHVGAKGYRQEEGIDFEESFAPSRL